jgi:signal peptidase II
LAATESADDQAPPGTAAPSSAPGDRPRRARAAVFGLLGAVAALVLVLDQGSKALVVALLPEDAPREVLGSLLVFRRLENAGAAFSMASGSTWVFSLIAAAVVVFLVVSAPRIRSLGWALLFGLLLGGTLGNLIDRLTRPPGFGVGHVVDFLQIPLLPAVFNLADSAIVASMALFILLTLRGVGLDGVRRPGTREKPDPAAAAGTAEKADTGEQD